MKIRKLKKAVKNYKCGSIVAIPNSHGIYAIFEDNNGSIVYLGIAISGKKGNKDHIYLHPIRINYESNSYILDANEQIPASLEPIFRSIFKKRNYVNKKELGDIIEKIEIHYKRRKTIP